MAMPSMYLKLPASPDLAGLMDMAGFSNHDKRQRFLILTAQAVGTTILLGAALVAAFLLGKSSISLKECGVRLSTWSPALAAVEYNTIMFSGKFKAPSVYRGTPNPELDQAWLRITRVGSGGIRISNGDLWRLNKTADESTLGFNGDSSGDAQALLEVFHQLHCLNELRKKTWPEYYPAPEKAHEEVDRAHLDHCIEMLRINLMCAADVTPVTANYLPGRVFPLPDFSTKHTCRNFEKIVEFVRDNAEQ